jgi:uncharacterized membrane protein
VNLRRGLFRLWIVGAALFVLAVAFVTYPSIKLEFDAVARKPDLLAYGTPPDMRSAPNPWASLGTAAAIAFGIPLVVLALGSSLGWALSRFAVTRH